MNVSLDRLKRAFDQCVEAVVSDIDYRAFYSFEVVSQNGDGTLEVKPTGKAATLKWPTMSNVRIWYENPGTKITVQPGAQVLVGWRDADPSQRIAVPVWANGGELITLEIDASEKVTINAPQVAIGNGASLAAARKTDGVIVNLTLADLNQFVFTAPPSGGPCVVTGATTTLEGEISEGSSEVTIG